MPTEIKPIEEQSLKPEYLTEDEIKTILDVFKKISLGVEDAKIIVPLNNKLEKALKEPTLEPDKKIQLHDNHIKVELEKP